MLRAGTCFALAVQVADAAAADFRMLGMAADVFAHVPAALALGVRQGRIRASLRRCRTSSVVFEQMKTKRRSSPSEARMLVLFAAQCMRTSACSEEPILPAMRSSSSARMTSAR
jgi:hypothetical protein